MQTITYDRLPENYDTRELAERADIAATYLGNKVRHIIGQGVPAYIRCCTTDPPTISLQPDHSWTISGKVVFDDDGQVFRYTAKILAGESDTIKIIGDYSQGVVVPLDPQSVCNAFLQLSTGYTPLDEWQSFDDDHKPQLDRPFHIKDSPDPKSLNVYRMHREDMHLATLQLRRDDGSWKEVDCANASWLIKNGKWHYADEQPK